MKVFKNIAVLLLLGFCGLTNPANDFRFNSYVCESLTKSAIAVDCKCFERSYSLNVNFLEPQAKILVNNFNNFRTFELI